MQYEKITNLLNKTNDQPSKFKTKEWVEVLIIQIMEITNQI